MVAERPIIMGAASARVILRDTKTKTRRVVMPQAPAGWDRHAWYSAPNMGWTAEEVPAGTWHIVRCPYGDIGERLWVREAFALRDFALPATCQPDALVTGTIFYRADQVQKEFDPSRGLPLTIAARRVVGTTDWRSPLFMPRCLSRLMLEIVSIRVERVQDITEEDAIAEGMLNIPIGTATWTNRQSFAIHWDRLNARRGYSWERNPWVWVVGFKRVEEG